MKFRPGIRRSLLTALLAAVVCIAAAEAAVPQTPPQGVKGGSVSLERFRGKKSIVRGGRMPLPDSLRRDSLGRDSLRTAVDSTLLRLDSLGGALLLWGREFLLLFTNDGEFANLIMHPSHHVSKTYRVTVRPEISDAQVVRLSTGVEIDGKKTSPAHVTVLEKQPGRVVLQVVIYEGRNRQVRKMCEAVGLEVARLKRTAVGPLKLGMLAPGKWRELRPGEIGMLRNAIKASSGAPEVLGDLDEDILNSAARKAAPAGKIQYNAQGKPRRSFEQERTGSKGGRQQRSNASFQKGYAPRGTKPQSKGAGRKPFTKKGSGM